MPEADKGGQAEAMGYDESVDLFNKAVALRKEEKLDEALDVAAQLIGSGGRSDDQVAFLLGDLFSAKRDFEQALHWNLLAYGTNPYRADILCNVANNLMGVGRHVEAVPYLQRAVHLSPHCALAHWNLSQCLLILDDYERGMEEYEWGRCVAGQRPLRTLAPEISKDELSALFQLKENVPPIVLYLWGEQGSGDNIFLFRYVQYLRRRLHPNVTLRLEVRPELMPLLCEQEPGVEVVRTQNDGGFIGDFDYHVNLFTLLRYFGPMPQREPLRVPATQPRAELPGTFRIGVCWKGSRTFRGDAERSMAPETFAPLISRVQDHGEVSFYSLVPQETIPGVQEVLLPDYAVTAAILDQLDLVVTTCTSVAHLAGAMHVPTYILLHATPYWVWGLGRDQNEFYPSVRLFRQRIPKDWSAPLHDAVEAIRKLVSIKQSLDEEERDYDGGMGAQDPLVSMEQGSQTP